MLNVEGGDKELRARRGAWRRARVDDALLRLRVAHAARALAGLGGAAYSLREQRLHLDAVGYLLVVLHQRGLRATTAFHILFCLLPYFSF